ncbi:armadillo-type protein [Mycena rosella]|uniref:Armadillo-type protein n=1 Tax=Mycena rosella TaxID=1033263 RepID=A0AAD7GJM7_MYCRO|nr:armadillo-type protein [Mycena rosella]
MHLSAPEELIHHGYSLLGEGDVSMPQPQDEDGLVRRWETWRTTNARRESWSLQTRVDDSSPCCVGRKSRKYNGLHTRSAGIAPPQEHRDRHNRRKALRSRCVTLQVTLESFLAEHGLDFETVAKMPVGGSSLTRLPHMVFIEWQNFLNARKAAVDARILDRLPVMLKSQNDGVRRVICELLGALACHKTSAAAVDEHPWVIESAAHALAQLAQWPCGAQAAVAAMVLDCIDDLFRSPNATVLHHTCWILARLACHDTLTTAVATLAVNPCVQLVFLLWQASNSGYLDPGTRGRFGSSTQNIAVTESATAALCELVKSPEGAQSAVDARVLEYVGDLLRSPNPVVWMLTCCHGHRGLGHPPRPSHRMPPTVNFSPLRLRTRGENPKVVEGAAYALCRISQSPCGAHATLNAGILNSVEQLIESPNDLIVNPARAYEHLHTNGELALLQIGAPTVAGLDGSRWDPKTNVFLLHFYDVTCVWMLTLGGESRPPLRDESPTVTYRMPGTQKDIPNYSKKQLDRVVPRPTDGSCKSMTNCGAEADSVSNNPVFMSFRMPAAPCQPTVARHGGRVWMYKSVLYWAVLQLEWCDYESATRSCSMGWGRVLLVVHGQGAASAYAPLHILIPPSPLTLRAYANI